MRGILIVMLVLAAGAFASADEEWVRPYEPYLPGTEPLDDDGMKKVVAVRLARRDEAAIVPVADGRVTCWTESTHGAELVAEALTDEYGIANLTASRDGGEHWHFEGKGAAPEHEFIAFGAFYEAQVLLRAGRDVPIVVRDPYGEPLVDAEVELYLGCPHSPSARTVRTGADGTAVIRDIEGPAEGIYWVRAPGVLPGPHRLGYLTVGTGGRYLIPTRAGKTVTGRVIEADGTPAVGVHVREQDWGRGPRTRTDGRGRFSLTGLSGAPLGVYRGDGRFGTRPAAVVEGYDPAVPNLVRLSKDRPTAPGDGEVRHLVEVVVRRAWPSDKGETVLPAGGVPVSITRRSDGFTLRGRSGRHQVAPGDAEGLVRFLAPPGMYRVTAGGRWTEFDPVHMEARVPPPRGEPIPMILRATRVRPELRWEGRGTMPEFDAMSAPGLDSYDHAWPAHVPRTGPAVAFYSGPVPTWLEAGPEENGRRRFTYQPPKPTRVRIRIDPPDLEVFLCPLNHEGIPFEAGEDGVFEARTWSAGPAMVRVEAENWRDPWIRVDLPSDPGAVVDLGTRKLLPSSPREIRFTGPDGESNLPVYLEEEPESGYDSIWAGVALDDSGAGRTGRVLLNSEKRRWPVTVRVIREDDEAPDAFTTRPFVFGRETPDVIPLPAGRIIGTVRGYRGPLPVVVYLDHDEFTFEDGKIDIRGVADGPHILIVGARKHWGEVRRIVIRGGETRNLEIRLPRRISKK